MIVNKTYWISDYTNAVGLFPIFGQREKEKEKLSNFFLAKQNEMPDIETPGMVIKHKAHNTATPTPTLQ